MGEVVGQLVRGQHVRSVEEHTCVYDACAVLDEFNIGALAVMRDGTLVGILSERDVIRRVVMRGRHFVETTVAEVMTPNPHVIDAAASPAEALTRMLDGHFRHLPVVENDRLIGMLSIRSIPVDTWFMKLRFDEMVTTPAAVAEAAIAPHRAERGGQPV